MMVTTSSFFSEDAETTQADVVSAPAELINQGGDIQHKIIAISNKYCERKSRVPHRGNGRGVHVVCVHATEQAFHEEVALSKIRI